MNGRLDEAVRWYRESIARDPGNAAVQANLGLCYLDLGDVESAAMWIDRAISRGPGQYWPVAAAMRLELWQRHRSETLVLADRLRGIWPRDNLSLLARVHLSDFQEAVDLYAERYPDLSCTGNASVGRENLFQAINLSLALEQIGKGPCARQLLEDTLQVMSLMPRLGSFGYGIADAEVQARL